MPLTGWPGKDDRTIIIGVLWVPRTGASYRSTFQALAGPARKEWPLRTVASRFDCLRKLEPREKLLVEVQRFPVAGEVEFEVHVVNGTRSAVASALC